MSHKGKSPRDKRNVIAFILAAAVIALCLLSSLQDKNGGDVFPALKAVVTQLFDSLDLGLENVLEPDEGDTFEHEELRVHFIDVEQGKAVLIQAPESTVLIDSGESASAPSLLAYLKEQKVDTIDLVIATHPHSDHIGGLSQVVSSFDIGDVIMPDIPMSLIPTTGVFTRLLEAIDAKGLSITPAKPGKTYDLGGGATLQILGPVGESKDLNNLSVAARLEYRQTAFLFTGDMEKEAEQEILNEGRNLRADVLDVAHHGSNSSSTTAFLEAISPSIAVISCGIDNSYGHPHREPLERLEAMETEIYRTDLDGTVVVSTDGADIVVRTER